MQRIRTGEGTIRDIEKNVLELCREAFDTADFLRYESDYRPAAQDFVDTDYTSLRISDVPALYAYVDTQNDDPNQVGGLGGQPRRNAEKYIVVVVYMTHFEQPVEGLKKVRRIGELLKDKLIANSDLNRIANQGGTLKNLNFDPKTIMRSDGTLGPMAAATIVMEYTIVGKKRRAA